jgi:hypothetical protein
MAVLADAERSGLEDGTAIEEKLSWKAEAGNEEPRTRGCGVAGIGDATSRLR